MDMHLLRISLINAAQLSFSRAGGPGGQNVNKVNTKVELRIPVERLDGLSDLEKQLLRTRLANRISNDDVLILTSSDERSQQANRELVLSKAESLIASAVRIPKHRKPTAPTRASRERRLEKKRFLGLLKKNRHPQNHDD